MKMWVWAVPVLMILVSSLPGFAALNDAVQVNDMPGWQIYPGGGYRYHCTSIINADNSIDMWMAGPDGPGADTIIYRRSTDGGHTWTKDQIVLQPTPGSDDNYSCCDPSVVKIGSYYYIGYTSTPIVDVYNHVFIARGTSPTGPFQKWNGTGWGGNPQPMIRFTGTQSQWGAGEPSMLIKDGKLYIYYSWVDSGRYTDLAICSDPNASDWPAHLELKGHIIDHNVSGTYSPIDVKYVDSLKRFMAIDDRRRYWPSSTEQIWQSEDGMSWQQTMLRGARIQCGSLGVKISGTETGHLDTSKNNFIAYAYQPPGSSWGNWPTYLTPVYLTTTGFGPAVNAEVSSIKDSTSASDGDWNYSGPFVSDGDARTVWCSVKHSTAIATEWVYLDLGSQMSVSGVKLTPRSDGKAFPVDFSIQSSSDAVNWTTIAGQSYTNYPSPGGVTKSFTFSSPVAARYIRLYATKLSVDDTGSYSLQLAEMYTVDVVKWSFETQGTAEGWQVINHVSDLQQQDGCLTGTVSGSDPYIFASQCPGIDAGFNRYIRIKLKVTAGSYAEFFWQTPTAPSYSPSREVLFNITSDGLMHDYVIDMSAYPQWMGIVTALRLDMTEASSGIFAVERIEVRPDLPDTTPPTGSVKINTGGLYTRYNDVTLTLSAVDSGSGVTAMRLSNDGANWNPWEAFTDTKDWTLSSGDGLRTVYAQYRDAQENTSQTYSKSITVDSTPPSTPGTPSAGIFSESTSITFTWSPSTDNTSGIKNYNCMIGTSPGTSNVYSGSVLKATSKTITGSRGNTYYCYVYSYDNAFNRSENSENSTGVMVVDHAGVSVQDAKGYPDATIVGLQDKIITAVYDNCFYVEEPDRTSGMNIYPTAMPADIAAGKHIDIGGTVEIAENGERRITSPFLANLHAE